MASPTQSTWVLASLGRWWRTGKPGMLQSMGLQRVGHDWATEQQSERSWSQKTSYGSIYTSRTSKSITTDTDEWWLHPWGWWCRGWCLQETGFTFEEMKTFWKRRGRAVMVVQHCSCTKYCRIVPSKMGKTVTFMSGELYHTKKSWWQTATGMQTTNICMLVYKGLCAISFTN